MNTSKHFQIHRKKGRRLLDEIPNGLHREPEAASADEGEDVDTSGESSESEEDSDKRLI